MANEKCILCNDTGLTHFVPSEFIGEIWYCSCSIGQALKIKEMQEEAQYE